MTTAQHLASTCGDWRQQLRDAIKDPLELLAMLDLEAGRTALDLRAGTDFPLLVPRSFAARMVPGDPGDPLLLQVLTSAQELATAPGYSADPVAESGDVLPRPGIIHKYRGRALLIVAAGCAINCRYCFRRHFPYAENQNSRVGWRASLDYVRNDTSIEEIILSGGDPLIAPDKQLAELVALIADIPHVQRLRIHSRLPIVLPDRVTPELVEIISPPGLRTVMVVHCNHAQEIDAEVGSAVARLKRADITVLNQAVLLAGVNDSAEAQVDLAQGLFRAGVLPYYLHLLDKVQGAAHFDVPESQALQLMQAISARLPGYLVPRLVREEAGAPAKTRLY